MIFIRTIPDSDSPLDEATRSFLRVASETPPISDMSVEDAIDQASRGECYIYTALDPEPVGAMVLKSFDVPTGITLNVVLLGGTDIMRWKEDAKRQVLKVMRQIDANSLCIVGRAGWARVFPELIPVGMVYTLPADR